MVDGKQLTLVVFVDDILASCELQKGLDLIHSELRQHFKELKFQAGEDLSYLGMRIRILNDKIKLTMDGYVNDFLAEHLDQCTFKSPATERLFEIDEKSPLLADKRREKFHRVVAQLLYLTLRVKFDIGVAISFLSTRVTKATQEDQNKLERVIGYLKLTSENGVTLHGDGDWKIRGYVDASFGTHCDGKSHTGMIIMFGNSTIIGKSSKQHMVTKDSTEAELVGASDKLDDIMTCHEFMVEQLAHSTVSMDIPALMQDNESAIMMMTEGVGSVRTKHLRTRKFRVKEYVDDDRLEIIYTPTKEMKADVLTKPLQGTLFRRHVNDVIGNEPLPHLRIAHE